MSSMERNKGKLVPTTWENILQKLPPDTEENNYDYMDRVCEAGYVMIKDTYYAVVWEVNQDDDCCGFADVKTNTDGSIDFHTYHYNGGGYWTEVIEGALN